MPVKKVRRVWKMLSETAIELSFINHKLEANVTILSDNQDSGDSEDSGVWSQDALLPRFIITWKENNKLTENFYFNHLQAD